MNPNLKRKWVLRMEENSLLHGKGFLNDVGKLCPLGVLASIFAEEGRAEWIFRSGHETAQYIKFEEEADLHYLPYKMYKMIGIDMKDQIMIANINDRSDNYNSAIHYIQTTL